MKKCDLGKDTYFVGDNNTYLEIKNVKEYVDIDGIKRYLVEIKDINKINMINKQLSMNSINSIVTKDCGAIKDASDYKNLEKVDKIEM